MNQHERTLWLVDILDKNMALMLQTNPFPPWNSRIVFMD